MSQGAATKQTRNRKNPPQGPLSLAGNEQVAAAAAWYIIRPALHSELPFLAITTLGLPIRLGLRSADISLRF